MADIAPIPSHSSPLYGPAGSRIEAATPTSHAAPAGPAGRSAGEYARPSDRVELSDRARLLSKLAALPEVRQDLIDDIRARIVAGTYDTPERLEDALDAMISELE
jgi:negative regulator of flagellin synthesis FlgM